MNVIRYSFIIGIAAVYFAQTAVAQELEPGDSHASEQIEIFASGIVIGKDGSFTVSETIAYDFGSLKRHGIYRDIPIIYERDDGSSFRLRMNVLRVVDGNDTALTYALERMGPMARIKIGDADEYISGKHIYKITYRVENGLLFHNDGTVELYWNATGTQWPGPIERAETIVRMPDRNEKTDVRIVCYTGALGSRGQECVSVLSEEEQSAAFSTILPLDAGEGLTLAIRFPRGSIREAGWFVKAAWALSDYFIFIVPFGYIFIYFLYWYKNGRDPGARRSIIPHYEPPDLLTPLEVGAIVDQHAGNRDLVAGIIHLAEQGFIKIKEVDREVPGLLGMSKKERDFEFARTGKEKRAPKDFEQKLLEALGLLSTASHSQRLSELKNGVFYDFIEPIHSLLYEHLVLNGYFPKSPQFTRLVSAAAGLVPLGVLGFAALFLPKAAAFAFFIAGAIVMTALLPWMMRGFRNAQKVLTKIFLALVAVTLGAYYLLDFIWVWLENSFHAFDILFFVALGISGFVVVIFSWFMPRRTEKGRRAYEHILGFKRYLAVVEKDRLAFHNPPQRTPEIFEKFLPYAMVLGVEKEWARQFESMTLPKVEWYSGNSFVAWNAVSLTDAMTHTASAMNTVFVSPEASGNGGFGGGGGFSGGGFGGGGGGSW